MMMPEWNKIIIHHSLTEDEALKQWPVIRTDHMENRSFLDIGYHYGLGTIRRSWEAVLGRRLSKQGAHCKGKNEEAIGICVLGNYDVMEPEARMYIELSELCIVLCMSFNIPAGEIYPHSEFAEKSCPGVNFKMSVLKNLVARGLTGEVV